MKTRNIDSETFASETNSATASAWARGLWTSVRTAAELTGLSIERVENLVFDGRVRAERRDGTRRVAVEDLIEVMKQGEPARPQFRAGSMDLVGSVRGTNPPGSLGTAPAQR